MTNKYENFVQSIVESTNKSGFEASGVKGMKSTPWRKTFKSQEEFEKWLEKNGDDYEVQRTRDLKD